MKDKCNLKTQYFPVLVIDRKRFKVLCLIVFGFSQYFPQVMNLEKFSV
jgi:hypothetical protein